MSSKQNIQVGGGTLWPCSGMQTTTIRCDVETKTSHGSPDLVKPRPKRVQSNPRVGSGFGDNANYSPEAEL